jgi:hypothetical protein
MSNTKSKLTSFTLKLNDRDKLALKLICAVDSSFKYQYDLFDAAVHWAFENKENLVAIANPRNGDYSSYYVSESSDKLNLLEEYWNCNSTRAMYTSLVNYIKFRNIDSLIHAVI